MDTTLMGAIVGAVGTIFGAGITAAVMIRNERRKDTSLEITEHWREALSGKWVGSIVQEIEGEKVSMPLTMTFKISGKVVKGKCKFTSFKKEEIELSFSGRFFREQFIRFEYQNVKEKVLQFGGAVLKLSADGSTLSGRYVGYGKDLDSIVSGSVSMSHAD